MNSPYQEELLEMVGTQNIVIEEDEETVESSNTLQMLLQQRPTNVMPLIKTLKVDLEKEI